MPNNEDQKFHSNLRIISDYLIYTRADGGTAALLRDDFLNSTAEGIVHDLGEGHWSVAAIEAALEKQAEKRPHILHFDRREADEARKAAAAKEAEAGNETADEPVNAERPMPVHARPDRTKLTAEERLAIAYGAHVPLKAEISPIMKKFKALNPTMQLEVANRKADGEAFENILQSLPK